MRNVHPDQQASIERVLDAHLRASATKDVALLRNSFTPEALWVGTDDAEVWSIDHLAELLAESGSGWDMTNCTRRSIYRTDGNKHEDVAMFFETVSHKVYGPMRGSGFVVRGEDGYWKIAQYVLSFSVPNEALTGTNLLSLLAGAS